MLLRCGPGFFPKQRQHALLPVLRPQKRQPVPFPRQPVRPGIAQGRAFRAAVVGSSHRAGPGGTVFQALGRESRQPLDKGRR
jgi:hypothetical protein